jgi:hypothetical protein
MDSERKNRIDENLSSDVQKGIIGCMEISKFCIPLGIQVQPYTWLSKVAWQKFKRTDISLFLFEGLFFWNFFTTINLLL